MSAIDTFRDALFGNPPSPTTEPSREGALAAFTEFYKRVDGLIASATSGIARYATKAAIPISPTPPTGSLYLVTDDPTPANNTYWEWDGDSLEMAAWYVDLIKGPAGADGTMSPASEAEMEAGESNDKVATPLNLAQVGLTKDWRDEIENTLDRSFAVPGVAFQVLGPNDELVFALYIDGSQYPPVPIETDHAAAGVTFQVLGPNDEMVFVVYDDGSFFPPLPPDFTGEIDAARGNRATLDDRMSVALDADGFDNRGLRDPEFMRNWQRNRRRLRAAPYGEGAAINHHILIGPADSFTYMKRWSTRFARALKAKYGDGGPGWVGFGFPSGNQAARNGNVDEAEIAVTFTNGLGAPTTDWTAVYSGEHRLIDLCSITTTVVGTRVRMQFNGTGQITSGSFHFLGGAGQGTFRYSINGASSWTTVDASLHSAPGVVTFSGATIATGTVILIEHVSGTVTLSGAFFRKGPGIIVSQIANTGSSLANWSQPLSGSTGTTKRAQLAAAWATLPVPIDEVITMIGTNDRSQGAANSSPDWYAAYEAGVGFFIDEVVRVAAPKADVLWTMQPQDGRDNDDYIWMMPEFARRARLATAGRRVTFLDLQQTFGAAWADYSDHFDGDLLHPSAAMGGPLIASAELMVHDPEL